MYFDMCHAQYVQVDTIALMVCRNVYGPTETTIWSTLWKAVAGEAVQIGKPVANTTLVILDDDHKPAQQGSLWIGGAGLSPGAHAPCALTAAAPVSALHCAHGTH